MRFGYLGERGEVAQIGAEKRRADGLAGAAGKRAGLHPGGTAPAEIGFEQRGPRLPRRQSGERRCGKTRDLAEQAGFGRSECTAPCPVGNPCPAE